MVVVIDIYRKSADIKAGKSAELKMPQADPVERSTSFSTGETPKVNHEECKASSPALEQNTSSEPLYGPIDATPRSIRLLRLESGSDDMLSFSLCVVNLEDINVD